MDGVTVREMEAPASEPEIEMALNLFTVCKIVTWWVLSVPVSLLTSFLLTKTLQNS
jgi:phosphate/sulfate permease